MPHALTGEGRCNGDGAVHAKRRGDAQQAGRDNAQNAPAFPVHSAEELMNRVFGENGDQRPDGNAQHPVPEDLAGLQLKIIPEINKLTPQDAEQGVLHG